LILHFNSADFDSAQSAAMITKSCLLSLSKQAKFQTDPLPRLLVLLRTIVTFESFDTTDSSVLTTHYMDLLFKIILILHILGGAIGLITGSINISRPKGDKTHKQVGSVFMVAMLTAGFSSLVLSVLHPNFFLFVVGVFTIYLTATGRRSLYFKQTQKTPQVIDWILTITMLLASIVFIGLGVIKLLKGNTFSIALIVFGVLGIRFSRTDIINYRGKSKLKNHWLTGHLQRMIGSYIAALTAFLVVNGNYIPDIFPAFLVWILPTIVLLPFIIRWTRKFTA